MKALISMFICSLAFCSFGEQVNGKTFTTLTQCKNHSKELVNQFDSISIREFNRSFGVDVEEDTETKHMLDGLDKTKSKSGEYKYTEEIGTYSLGNFLTKIGYIIKYKSGAFFCEVEIGKTAESEYGIIGVKIIGQQSARELIKGIPDYYWR